MFPIIKGGSPIIKEVSLNTPLLFEDTPLIIGDIPLNVGEISSMIGNTTFMIDGACGLPGTYQIKPLSTFSHNHRSEAFITKRFHVFFIILLIRSVFYIKNIFI